jgi:hypothetical protein
MAQAKALHTIKWKTALVPARAYHMIMVVVVILKLRLFQINFFLIEKKTLAMKVGLDM